jgi:hypothetical protein
MAAIRPIASQHLPGLVAKGSQAGPSQADTRGAPRHGNRAHSVHGGMTDSGSLTASM